MIILSLVPWQIATKFPWNRLQDCKVEQPSQSHLRYDNKLIGYWSGFPKGSFVCKPLTLNWHVDIIKLMKCYCNEHEEEASVML